MKKDFKVLPPTMPNFARIETCSGRNDHTIPIANFTKEEAEEYAELMKQTFINHWKKRKEHENKS